MVKKGCFPVEKDQKGQRQRSLMRYPLLLPALVLISHDSAPSNALRKLHLRDLVITLLRACSNVNSRQYACNHTDVSPAELYESDRVHMVAFEADCLSVVLVVSLRLDRQLLTSGVADALF
nr:hypothetical protein CFP56_22485 [Quercus suber]